MLIIAGRVSRIERENVGEGENAFVARTVVLVETAESGDEVIVGFVRLAGKALEMHNPAVGEVVHYEISIEPTLLPTKAWVNGREKHLFRVASTYKAWRLANVLVGA